MSARSSLPGPPAAPGPPPTDGRPGGGAPGSSRGDARRTGALLAGVLTAALALAVAGYALLPPGPDAAAPAVRAAPGQSAVTALPLPPLPPPPQPSSVPGGTRTEARDPFQPQVDVVADRPAGSSTLRATSPGSSTDPSASPSVSPSPSPVGVVAGPGGGTGASTAAPGSGPQLLELREVLVRQDRVLFHVHGRVAHDFHDHRVKPGEIFAGDFRLVSYDERRGRDCAVVLYRDLPVSLCEGETYQGTGSP